MKHKTDGGELMKHNATEHPRGWRRRAIMVSYVMHVLIMLLLLCLSAIADAATYHTAKTGGSAEAISCPAAQNWGSNPTQARLLISDGLACLVPGDTLIIHEGDYNEQGLVPPSGTSGLPITIQAASNETVTIQGSVGSVSDPLINLGGGGSYLTFERLILDCRQTSESSGTGRGLLMYSPSTNIIMRDSEVKNCGEIGITIQPLELEAPYYAFAQFINVNVHHNGFWYPGTALST